MKEKQEGKTLNIWILILYCFVSNPIALNSFSWWRNVVFLAALTIPNQTSLFLKSNQFQLFSVSQLFYHLPRCWLVKPLVVLLVYIMYLFRIVLLFYLFCWPLNVIVYRQNTLSDLFLMFFVKKAWTSVKICGPICL